MTRDCMTVLMVEHDPITRFYAAQLAEGAGFIALEAGDAAEAIAMLDGHSEIRVVVSRIRLPAGMDGIELVGTIRRCQPEVGIMITYGRALPPDADLPTDAVLLPKPYTHTCLPRHWKTWLRGGLSHVSGTSPSQGKSNTSCWKAFRQGADLDPVWGTLGREPDPTYAILLPA